MKIQFTRQKISAGRVFRQANNKAYACESSHKAVDADGAPNGSYAFD